MNLYRLAVIMLRVNGIGWFVNSFLTLVSLPASIFGLLQANSVYFQTLSKTSLAMLFVSAFFESGVGAFFIVQSQPVAIFLIRSFVDGATLANAPQTVWPPAPRKSVSLGYVHTSSQEDVVEGVRRTAILVVKAEGLFWLLGVPIELSQTAGSIIGLLHHHGDYYASQYLLGLSTVGVRLLIEIGVGLYFLFLPEALAKRITNDLVRDAESENDFSAPTLPSETVPETDTNTLL